MIAPTIIIGLGGCGGKIATLVAQRVNTMISEEDRRHISFVAIDTDVNELTQLAEIAPGLVTIQISAPYTVGDYLEKDVHARENWFPVHEILEGKTPTEGAGQMRAISRLAFDNALCEGRFDALDHAVENLYRLNGAAQSQALRVIIVSSLAGGTGSGIILPVALYVKHFLATRFQQNASVMRGFMVLPEVFFDGKGPEERNNLCCNAYASLRELDAFMRRGDGALDKIKYQSLKLEMPDASTGEYVDYDVEPFNFCFLYDAKNANNMKLNSYNDYMQHAANTIFAQAISALSARSNSSEDNTIRALAASGGRSRFCGAGSSTLLFPKAEVRRYLADCWATACMTEEWLEIDNKYEDYARIQIQARRKAPALKIKPRSDFYINTIEANDNNSFYQDIVCCVRIVDEKTMRTEDLWDKYICAIGDHVQKGLDQDESMQQAIKQANSTNAELTAADSPDTSKEKSMRDMLSQRSQAINVLKRRSEVSAQSVSQTVVQELYHCDAGTDYTDTTVPYMLEHWLHDENGAFLHPNAVRYFLYKLQKVLQKSIEDGRESVTDSNETYHAQILTFDNPKTQNRTESAEEYINSRVGTRLLFVKTDRAACQQAIDSFKVMEESILSSYAQTTKNIVLEATLRYVESMIAAYEAFYKSFDKCLTNTRSECAHLETRYKNGEGRATRYVCANQRCLTQLAEKNPMNISGLAIDGPLCAKIFQGMREFAMHEAKPATEKYFTGVYEEVVMKYWLDAVQEQQNSLIEMDVITALETEAELECQDGLTERESRAYVKGVLEEAIRLAAPFIEQPMGETKHPLQACAYNKAVLKEENSIRATFVHEMLDKEGGIADESVSPDMMIFYHALYGLAASDLKRFKPNADGEYYVSYYTLINQLGPNTSANKVLTPHLDRRWHLTKYMPEMSDEIQNKQIMDVYSAMVYGLLSQSIEYKHIGNHILYRPEGDSVQDFIVPNGTPCDRLNELVDALAINPPQTQTLLANMREMLRREINNGIPFYASFLVTRMNWKNLHSVLGATADKVVANSHLFAVEQFAPQQRASLLDLVYWFKCSTPTNEYAAEDVRVLMLTMFEMIETYVCSFYSADQIGAICTKIWLDQFKLLLDNLCDDSFGALDNRIHDEVLDTIRDSLKQRLLHYDASTREVDSVADLYFAAVKNYDNAKVKANAKSGTAETHEKRVQEASALL